MLKIAPNRPEPQSGVHYPVCGTGQPAVTAADNLACFPVADQDAYQFFVTEVSAPPFPEYDPGVSIYEPILMTPQTDMTGIPTDLLREMAEQLRLSGESGRGWGKDAKFSGTRDHIETELRERREAGDELAI